jgi:hypothetical protein
MLRVLAAGVSAAIWFSPASAYYFGYSKWLTLPYQARVAYIAGAYDALTGFENPAGGRHPSWEVCVNNAQMSIAQLTDNVQNFAKDKPQYQTGMV